MGHLQRQRPVLAAVNRRLSARPTTQAPPRVAQFVAFDHTLLRAAAADGFTSNPHIRDSSA
jgi:hypothetical protein